MALRGGRLRNATRDRQVPSAPIRPYPQAPGAGPIRPASPCDGGHPGRQVHCRSTGPLTTDDQQHRRFASVPGRRDLCARRRHRHPVSPPDHQVYSSSRTVAICQRIRPGSATGAMRDRSAPSPRPRACSAGTTRRPPPARQPRWLRSSTAAATRHPRPTPPPRASPPEEQFGEVFRYRPGTSGTRPSPRSGVGITRGAAPPTSSTSVTSLGAVARSRGRLLLHPCLLPTVSTQSSSQ